MYRTRKTTKAYDHERKHSPHHKTDGCAFCAPEAIKILKTGKTMRLVRNKFPYEYWEHINVVDHLMVVPIRHVESISDFTAEEKIEAMDLFGTYEAMGYNVYGRAKENIIKTIPHQHTHLIKISGTRAKLALFVSKPYILWKV